MSVTAVRHITRPNTINEFWHLPNFSVEVTQYIVEHYVHTGLRQHISLEWSEDLLTFTITGIWASIDAYNQFETDPYLITNYWQARQIYCDEHNHTIHPVQITQN